MNIFSGLIYNKFFLLCAVMHDLYFFCKSCAGIFFRIYPHPPLPKKIKIKQNGPSLKLNLIMNQFLETF